MPPSPPKKPRGRPKAKPGAKSAPREVRRQKLAAAAFTGKPITDVARETGISRSWASQETNAPATRALIAQMVDEHAGEIRQLVRMGIDAIRDCIAPFAVIEDNESGKSFKLPNEPRVRMLATKRVIEIAQAGRHHEDSKGQAVTITWQQFLTIYEQKQGAVK